MVAARIVNPHHHVIYANWCYSFSFSFLFSLPCKSQMIEVTLAYRFLFKWKKCIKTNCDLSSTVTCLNIAWETVAYLWIMKHDPGYSVTFVSYALVLVIFRVRLHKQDSIPAFQTLLTAAPGITPEATLLSISQHSKYTHTEKQFCTKHYFYFLYDSDLKRTFLQPPASHWSLLVLVIASDSFVCKPHYPIQA